MDILCSIFTFFCWKQILSKNTNLVYVTFVVFNGLWFTPFLFLWAFSVFKRNIHTSFVGILNQFFLSYFYILFLCPFNGFYLCFQCDEDPPHAFSQVFVLKPLGTSFFVQHDIFRLGIHDSV